MEKIDRRCGPKRWTPEEVERFHRLYENGVSVEEIARRFGLTPASVRAYRHVFGVSQRRPLKMGRKGIEEDPEVVKFLKKNYPIMSRRTIAIYLGCCVDTVTAAAKRLGLEKSPEYLAEQKEYRVMRMREAKAKREFIKSNL